jgi:hypothetical protein
MNDLKFSCQYGTYSESVDRMRCTKSGALVYTDCHKGIAGDPPKCAYEEIDNSDEAVARRLEWMEGNR